MSNRHSNSLLVGVRDGDGNLLDASLLGSSSSLAMKLFQNLLAHAF